MDKEIVQNFDINATNKKQVRLDAKIYSQDIESAVFHLSFSDNGTELNLDDSYVVTILSVFRDSGRKLLVDAPIVDGEALFTFDNRLITNWDVVDSYVYLKKGIQTVDVNSFSFKVDVSKIDSVISDIKVYYIEDLEDLKAEYIKKMESINKDYQDFLDAYIDGLPSTEDLKGKAGTIDVIGIEVLEENEDPKVINSGTESSAKLTFQLPRGRQGIQGERGEQGSPADTLNNYSELIAKYPSGSNKPMIVKEPDGITGYIYTWTDNAWKKGVLYQGIGLYKKSVTFDKLYVDSFDALSTADIFGGKGIGWNDGNNNIVLIKEPNSTVYRIPLDQTGFMKIKLFEPVSYQSIFVVDKNNKMVFRKTWRELQNLSLAGWTFANNILEIDIEVVRQLSLSDAIYVNIPTSRINEFKADTIGNIDPANLKYLDLRNYKNPPSDSLKSLSDKYMPFESEKLLNKCLTGYVVTTGKVALRNDSSWMTFKIINVPNKGTLTLPKPSITSNQLFVLEDSNQVCFNNVAYSKKESWFNFSETQMTISFTDLIRIYPRTVTLYVGFMKADDENFFSEAQNIAQLSDVFKWAEEPNQDKLTEYNLNFPPYVPLVAGKESYIYFDNLLIDKNFYAQSIPAIAINRREDKVVLSGISNYTQSINFGGVLGNIPIKAISESAGAGKNLKVMVIGESTSEDGRFMTNLKNFFDLDVVNIDFIGTRTSGGVRHEARSGWGSGTLRYIENANNATNSFWNPDTREFDLDYYFSQHSDVPIPDVILLNFGINEVNRYVTDGRSGTQSEHYDFFIREFRKKNPNLISIVGLSHSFSRWSNYWAESERDNIMKLTKQTIGYFKDRESEKIFLNPWYVCLDMRWDFPYSEIKSNQFSEKTSIVGTNNVHPDESGYKNMALMSYFAIKYAVSTQ